MWLHYFSLVPSPMHPLNCSSKVFSSITPIENVMIVEVWWYWDGIRTREPVMFEPQLCQASLCSLRNKWDRCTGNYCTRKMRFHFTDRLCLLSFKQGSRKNELGVTFPLPLTPDPSFITNQLQSLKSWDPRGGWAEEEGRRKEMEGRREGAGGKGEQE